MKRVVVFSSMDGLPASEIRLLQEAEKRGEVHLIVPSDEAVRAASGKPPRFPFAERLYLARALRYAKQVFPGERLAGEACMEQTLGFRPDLCVCGPGDEWNFPGNQEDCELVRLTEADLAGFPEPSPLPLTGRPKVVVTGCYDWLHSGHVAFFEECAALGDLHVCLGNDANLRALKGEGHPLFKGTQRRFLVSSIRHVTQAYISKGMGHMDAEDEILNVIRPAIYAVNEDGHKPEKAAFCAKHGIRYLVLKRVPKAGLSARTSTSLRGF